MLGTSDERASGPYHSQAVVAIDRAGAGRHQRRAGDQGHRGVVTNYFKELANGGSFQSTVNWSYHKNKVTKVSPNPAVLDALGNIGFQRITRSQAKGLLADQMPRSKFIWTNTWKTGNWGFTGTAVRYGGVTEYSSTSYIYDTYPARWIFNLAANYYHDRWTFTLASHLRHLSAEGARRQQLPRHLPVPEQLAVRCAGRLRVREGRLSLVMPVWQRHRILSERPYSKLVIPAKAGIQCPWQLEVTGFPLARE
ncbi:hypothetical protein [Rhodanobacter lindaniclasticus]